MLGRALLRLGGCWLLAAVFLDLWRRVLVVGFLIMLGWGGAGPCGEGTVWVSGGAAGASDEVFAVASGMDRVQPTSMTSGSFRRAPPGCGRSWLASKISG